MNKSYIDLLKKLFIEADIKEINVIASCLSELPEQTQKHLIGNLFASIQGYRTKINLLALGFQTPIDIKDFYKARISILREGKSLHCESEVLLAVSKARYWNDLRDIIDLLWGRGHESLRRTILTYLPNDYLPPEHQIEVQNEN